MVHAMACMFLLACCTRIHGIVVGQHSVFEEWTLLYYCLHQWNIHISWHIPEGLESEGLAYTPASSRLLVNILFFIDRLLINLPESIEILEDIISKSSCVRNNEYVLELLGYKWITNNYISSPWLVCRQQSACRLTAVHHAVQCQPRSHQSTVAADRGQSGHNNYRLM